MKIQNRIVIHGILCALNGDFYFDFYSAHRCAVSLKFELEMKSRETDHPLKIDRSSCEQAAI